MFCKRCHTSTYTRPVPQIVYQSDDASLVRLLSPPPAPSLPIVLDAFPWLRRLVLKLQWKATGKVPDPLVMELRRAEEGWGRGMRLWEALHWCEFCKELCLPPFVRNSDEVLVEMKTWLEEKNGVAR